MSQVLSETHPIARKDYPCDACCWLINGGLPDNMTLTEAKAFVRARRDGFKIKAGQRYLKQYNIFGGEAQCFRARPEIDAICHKYDIYEEP